MDEAMSDGSDALQPRSASEFPFEIIAEVLAQACRVERRGDRPVFATTPLFLCQICKAWRKYITSTPKFWATVIVVLRKANMRAQPICRGLSRWLRRAGNLSLEVYLDGVGALSTVPASLAQLFKTIAASALKWKSVEFYCLNSHVSESLMNLVESTLKTASADQESSFYTLLKSITLINRTGTSIYPYDFSRAPLLTSITFNGCQPSVTGVVKHCPPQITGISLKNIEGLASGRVLAWYPHVKRAEFINIHVHPAFQSFEDEHIVHEQLRSLTVEGESWSDVVCFFQSLQAPNLEKLSLSSFATPKTPAVHSLQSFVVRSACRLTHLHLSIIPTEEQSLAKLLSFVPTLDELHLRQVELEASNRSASGLSRTFFDSFYPLTASTTTFLPNLQKFTYVGNLSVDSIDFLEPLVLRARTLPLGHSLPPSRASLGPDDVTFRSVGPLAAPICKLAFTKIQANKTFQDGSGDNMSDFLFRVATLVEAGSFWLLEESGEPWSFRTD